MAVSLSLFLIFLICHSPVEIIDLSDEDFVNNIYVAENCEFVREGIKLVTTEKVYLKKALMMRDKQI